MHRSSDKAVSATQNGDGLLKVIKSWVNRSLYQQHVSSGEKDPVWLISSLRVIGRSTIVATTVLHCEISEDASKKITSGYDYVC